ncbi:MAG: sulfite exporter TauE/SafE family protein [Desulfobaccales bacterium]
MTGTDPRRPKRVIMEVYQLVVLAAATAASAIISNGVAIGSGIFLLPVLSLAFPAKVALGLGAPLMFASSVVGVKNYWGEWGEWRELLRFSMAATVGIILGSCLINIIPNHLFKIGVGIFAICFSLYQLLKGYAARLWFRPLQAASLSEIGNQGGKVLALVVGFLGGVVTVLCHAGGAVWSMYFVSRKLDKRCLVSTLLPLFAFSNLLKIFTYWGIGILSPQSTLIVLAMSPLVILSSNFGNYLNKKVRPELFRNIVLLIILVAGISLIIF